MNVHCDADFNNDLETSRSITSVIALVFGNLVDWYLRRQKRVTNSTCHAEVLAIVDGAVEFIYYLRNKMKLRNFENVTLMNDNQSAIATVLECDNFQSNKHYRRDVNLVRELVTEGWLKLVYCQADDMLADFLTKALVQVTEADYRKAAGMKH